MNLDLEAMYAGIADRAMLKAVSPSHNSSQPPLRQERLDYLSAWRTLEMVDSRRRSGARSGSGAPYLEWRKRGQ